MFTSKICMWGEYMSKFINFALGDFFCNLAKSCKNFAFDFARLHMKYKFYFYTRNLP